MTTSNQISDIIELKKSGMNHREISMRVFGKTSSASTVHSVLNKHYYNQKEQQEIAAKKAVQVSDELNEIIRLSKEGLSNREISEVTGRSPTSVSKFLKRKTHTEFWEAYDIKPISSGTKQNPTKRKQLDGKRFVFTSAQNNTPVHKEFLDALKIFCEVNKAELIVGTFNYNKSGFQNGPSEETWFDPAIRNYILNESRKISDDLIWCGELSILPTAVNPMSGFQSYTQESGGIIPHVKVQLDPLPRANGKGIRQLFTTGAVTQQNYVPQKAGQKAGFHHVFGATYVEIDDDGNSFPRQLIAESETGCFYDLDKYYTPTHATGGHTLEAINYGDVHGSKVDEVVADISWGDNADSILNVLKPRHQFLHDVFDMSYRNHHNIKDPHFRFKMHAAGTESVKDELKQTAGLMSGMLRPYSQLVVVESNHDLALEKWLREQDYRYDPVNAIFFLELQTAAYKAMAAQEEFHVFEHACREVDKSLYKARFLRTDESFLICGDIECGAHGHNGNNGARGSIRAFQMRGTRYNTGHTHSAAIKDGVYIAGVSGKLQMGYNVGGTSWSQSHILTYPNGKRTIITIKDGKWRV